MPTLPSRTDGSLGRRKVDLAPPADLDHYITAQEWNNVCDAIVGLATAGGPDVSTRVRVVTEFPYTLDFVEDRGAIIVMVGSEPTIVLPVGSDVEGFTAWVIGINGQVLIDRGSGIELGRPGASNVAFARTSDVYAYATIRYLDDTHATLTGDLEPIDPTPQFAAGTYTPTITSPHGVVGPAGLWSWMRVGDVVHVAGHFYPEEFDTHYDIVFTLPVASSVAAASDVAGIIRATQGNLDGAGVDSDGLGNARMNGAIQGDQPYLIMFQYRVY